MIFRKTKKIFRKDGLTYMHKGTRLKYFISRSTLTNAEIARLSGISEMSLYNYQKAEDIDPRKLKKVLDALGVTQKQFDGENETADSACQEKVKLLESQIDILKKQLADKDEIIDLLKQQQKKPLRSSAR